MRQAPSWLKTTGSYGTNSALRLALDSHQPISQVRRATTSPRTRTAAAFTVRPKSGLRSFVSSVSVQQKANLHQENSTMAEQLGAKETRTSKQSHRQPPPPITHILETCLQVKDLKASTAFYRDVLNVQPFLDTPRMSGFSFAQTTLLLFQLGATAADSHMADNRGTIPGHGPTQNILDLLLASNKSSDATNTDDNTITSTSASAGNSKVSSSPSPSNPENLHQHFCFAVPSPDDVSAWEQWFEDKKVKVLGKVEWPRGGRSVYFADLDGNVGEVASRGIWGHY
ncbi:hypothetical protein ABEF95_005419 [Exophiala dermatitidis]